MTIPRPKTRVLIVDDSALVRRMLSEIVSSAPDLEVVGEAPDPFVARDLIKKLSPDVLTLDVEMPRMDGLTFLGNLMRLRPMPVVMISSLTEAGADITLDALSLGAVDFVAKPRLDLVHGLDTAADEIVARIRNAAASRPRAHDSVSLRRSAPRAVPSPHSNFRTTDTIIAIGASTGGTEAICELLTSFPSDAPGTVVTQHIPAQFSKAFAARLDKLCSVRVLHAEDGQRILPGHAYIAPGGIHMTVGRNGAHWICRLEDTEPINHHKPSVDALFESVARAAGRNALAALLTGMGDDGARGLKCLRDRGAFTVAQDEATSVVWGMPGSAVRLGAALQVLPLEQIAGSLITAVANRR